MSRDFDGRTALPIRHRTVARSRFRAAESAVPVLFASPSKTPLRFIEAVCLETNPVCRRSVIYLFLQIRRCLETNPVHHDAPPKFKFCRQLRCNLFIPS
jgi:hypothetical protein